MIKRVLFPTMALILTGTALNVQAQQNSAEGIRSEISLVWGMAQGTFGDNVDRPIPGFVVAFGGESPGLPLILSTEIGWLNYGFDDHLELRFADAATPAGPPISVVNIETGNSILMAHLVARLAPFEGAVTPYVDALIGVKYFISRVNIESEALFDDDDFFFIGSDDRIFTSATFNSLAMSYGAGAGIDVLIFDGPLGLHNRHTVVSLHMGVRYLFGSEADYLTRNSIRAETNSIRFDQITSDTDMLIPELGLRIGL